MRSGVGIRMVDKVRTFGVSVSLLVWGEKTRWRCSSAERGNWILNVDRPIRVYKGKLFVERERKDGPKTLQILCLHTSSGTGVEIPIGTEDPI